MKSGPTCVFWSAVVWSLGCVILGNFSIWLNIWFLLVFLFLFGMDKCALPDDIWRHVIEHAHHSSWYSIFRLSKGINAMGKEILTTDKYTELTGIRIYTPSWCAVCRAITDHNTRKHHCGYCDGFGHGKKRCPRKLRRHPGLTMQWALRDLGIL